MKGLKKTKKTQLTARQKQYNTQKKI